MMIDGAPIAFIKRCDGIPNRADCGGVVGHVASHRLGCPIRYCGRGDKTHDSRTLGKPAEHHLGVGAGCRHVLDVVVSVIDAV